MNFGTRFLSENKIEFNFWAPDAKTVCLLAQNSNAHLSFEIPMIRKKDGWFQLITEHIRAGAKYRFRLEFNKNSENYCNNGLLVPDPASRMQEKDVHDPSIIVNPDSFDWEDDYKFKGRPWIETVIYEIHTGTFTEEGDFKGIEKKLDYLVSLGITAIELMPVADFQGGRNWGYDGVLLYAPDSSYGTSKDLKSLIKAAHKKGLMVFMDVVYNHFGPEGNYLYVYAKSKFFNSEEKTPWGDTINFENKNVRRFFVQNALYWFEEYHIDGLRIDAVHAIKDNSKHHILKEIEETVRKNVNNRYTHLILENDNNESKYLNTYTAQWNDDFHHAIHVILTGEKTGYYEDFSEEKTSFKSVFYLARALAEGFAYQGEQSSFRNGISRGENSKNLSTTSFINFLQNHDQTGNRFFAERISCLASQEAVKAAACLYLLAPSIPLIFMGEEFFCEQPFFFFCDFEECLAKSVREGRKANTAYLSGTNVLKEIPDATSEKVFMDSKIDWAVAETAKHRIFLEFYKNLLVVRKKNIIPIISKLVHSKTSFEIIGENLFFVIWKTEKGKELRLLANLCNKESCLNPEYINKLSDKSLLIFESIENSYSLLKKENIIKNWGVYWFVGKDEKTTA